MSGGISAARGLIRKQEVRIEALEGDVSKYLRVIEEYRKALTKISDIEEESETQAVGIAHDALGLHGEPHSHTCQQCDKIVKRDCECNFPRFGMYWCSTNCMAAFDL